MKRLLALATVIASLLFFVQPPGVQAAVFAETGDAGDLPGTAAVARPNPVTQISGEISSGTDADMYLVCLTGNGTFSATTVGTPGTLVDTALFLFDAAGRGVEFNDDSAAVLRSSLPAGGLAPATAGAYFLAIAAFDRDPVSSGGEIFLDQPFNTVHGPDGPGGAQPISAWNSSGTTGTYTINLTGTGECAPCPLPTTPPMGAIVGTSGPDNLVGTPGPDVIYGLGGNDTISGLDGQDQISGGPGIDTIFGGNQNDLLCGNEDGDRILGGAGNDSIYGNDGGDQLRGEDDNDSLYGGDGADSLDGGPGTNTNDGGPDFDQCGNPSTGVLCRP